MARTCNPEPVVIDDVAVVLMLKQLVGSGHRLTGYGQDPQTASEHVEMGGLAVALGPSVWQPYGLRRGGACEDWATHDDAGRLCMRGDGLNKKLRTYMQLRPFSFEDPLQFLNHIRTVLLIGRSTGQSSCVCGIILVDSLEVLG